jgi:hypothetical protein
MKAASNGYVRVHLVAAAPGCGDLLGLDFSFSRGQVFPNRVDPYAVARLFNLALFTQFSVPQFCAGTVAREAA